MNTERRPSYYFNVTVEREDQSLMINNYLDLNVQQYLQAAFFRKPKTAVTR